MSKKYNILSLMQEDNGKWSAKRILGILCMGLLIAFAISSLSADEKIVNEKLALQVEEHVFFIIAAVVVGITWNFKDYFFSKKSIPMEEKEEMKE